MHFFLSLHVIPGVVPPFCEIVLKAPKPLPKGYPAILEQVGDYIRAKRLDLGWYQSQVAPLLGVSKEYMYQLELNQYFPKISLWPNIIKFLGFDPLYKDSEKLGERVLHYRRCHGLTQLDLSKKVGLDPATINRIEQEEERCFRKSIDRMEEYLELKEKRQY